MSSTSWLYRFASRSANQSNTKTRHTKSSQVNESHPSAINSNESICSITTFNLPSDDPSNSIDQESSATFISMPQSLLDYEKRIGQTAAVAFKETLPRLFESCGALINEIGRDLSNHSGQSTDNSSTSKRLDNVKQSTYITTKKYRMGNGSPETVDKKKTNWQYLKNKEQNMYPAESIHDQDSLGTRYSTVSNVKCMNEPSALPSIDHLSQTSIAGGSKRKRDQDIKEDIHSSRECLIQQAEGRPISGNVPIHCLKRPQGYSSSINLDRRTIRQHEVISVSIYDSKTTFSPKTEFLNATNSSDQSGSPIIQNTNNTTMPKKSPSRAFQISRWNKALCDHIYCILECSIQMKLLLQQNGIRDKLGNPSTTETLDRLNDNPYLSRLHPGTRSRMKLELEGLTNGGNNILNAIEKYHSTRLDLLLKMEQQQKVSDKNNEDTITVHSVNSSITVGDDDDDDDGDEPDEPINSCLSELDSLLELLDERQQNRLWLWASEIQASCAGMYRLLKSMI